VGERSGRGGPHRGHLWDGREGGKNVVVDLRRNGNGLIRVLKEKGGRVSHAAPHKKKDKRENRESGRISKGQYF